MAVRVGVIANPVSARDIRRITSHAAGLALGERANILLRLLQALGASGVDEVLLMSEREGLRSHLTRLLPMAQKEAAHRLPRLSWLDMPVLGNAADTLLAAEMMLQAGVRVLLVLGGDGTHRLVAKACANVPIAGVSTGTNNAFAPMREATITAWAVGLFATGQANFDGAVRAEKCLHIIRRNEAGEVTARDMALVDAGILNERVLGAKAISSVDTLRTVVVTRASVESVGLSAIAAMVQPVSRAEQGGLVVELLSPTPPHAAPSEQSYLIQAAISPGLVGDVQIASARRLMAGEPYVLTGQAGLVALDGERELAFRDSDCLEINLQEVAFYSINVVAILQHHALHLLAQPTVG